MAQVLVRLLLLARSFMDRGLPDYSNLKVLLLHTNDIHARYQEVNRDMVRCDDITHRTCYGGVARLHAAKDRYELEAAKRGVPTIYLDAGDLFQDTVFYTEFKWKLAAKIVNMLGMNAMSLGNHEFDDKVEGLVPFIKNVKVPIVCCNIDVSEEPSLKNLRNLMPSKILTIRGRKIGIIGYLTPDISERNLGKVKINDEIESIRAEAQKLQSKGVKILIALGHSGYNKDKEIAEKVEEIDIVVGGHSHFFLYTGDPPSDNTADGPYPTEIVQSSGKIVPVLQASFGTKYLGYLNLEFDKDGNLINYNGLPKLLSGNMPQKPLVLKKLKPYASIITRKYRKKIGTTLVFLEGDSAKCKFKECNIGNMITDAYVEYVANNHRSSQGWPFATIAIIHSGAIRSSLHPKSDEYSGNIVLEDIMTVLPFASELVILKLPGHVLRDALEHAVKRYQVGGSMFYAYLLQVSGLRITYDVSRKPGDRLVDVQVRCAECDAPFFAPLNPDAVYGVIMPKFLAQGGDNFVMFKSFKHEHDLNVIDYVVVSKYIEAHSPLNNVIEGRTTLNGL